MRQHDLLEIVQGFARGQVVNQLLQGGPFLAYFITCLNQGEMATVLFR
jgi:hypothetical protein